MPIGTNGEIRSSRYSPTMSNDSYRIAMILVGSFIVVIPTLVILDREAEAMSYAIIIGIVALGAVSFLKPPRPPIL